MALWKTALVGAVLLVGGCSFATDSLLPTLTGEEPSGKPKEQTAATQAAEAAPVTTEPLTTQPAAPPQLNSGNLQLAPIEPGKPTGTAVGQKVATMRQDLGRLQASVSAHNSQLQSVLSQTTSNAQQYYQLVAAINAKLQVGTTPSNPILVNQWNQAQSILGKIDGDVASLNALSNGVANDSAQAAYLLDAIRATYTLPGAVDEDHRQLAVLEDETNKTVVPIDRLLNELSEDTSRQSLYVARERSNLATLSVAIKNGELFGSSLANRAYGAPVAAAPARASASSSKLAGRRPLVVIRFDRPDVNYETALYTAVSEALARKPDARFDIVAVAPTRGGTARAALARDQSKKNADAVMRSLTNMGLPADRMTLSATTSRVAETSEVHLYVR
ncbi:MAG TPA: hypothetical protein VKY65_10230 [Alphaproteobacteria bacterium]|nr:hypothetical protein [Alphaproteobacteria bacterium]